MNELHINSLAEVID